MVLDGGLLSACGPDASGGLLTKGRSTSSASEGSDDRGRWERGATLVEFAFVLPVLLLIILGIIDFGRAYGAKQELIHATREGVRVYAVTQDYGQARAAFDAGATGLDPARVSVVIPADDSCSLGDPVEVTATYDFDFIALPLASMDIGSEAVMQCGG